MGEPVSRLPGGREEEEAYEGRTLASLHIPGAALGGRGREGSRGAAWAGGRGLRGEGAPCTPSHARPAAGLEQAHPSAEPAQPSAPGPRPLLPPPGASTLYALLGILLLAAGLLAVIMPYKARLAWP